MTDRPGHLASGILMLDNVTVNNKTGTRTPLGDVLRRSACGLTPATWQDPDYKPKAGDHRLCGNCARTAAGKRWLANLKDDACND